MSVIYTGYYIENISVFGLKILQNITIVCYKMRSTKHHYKSGVYYTYKHHVHMYMYDYMHLVHVYTIQCIVYNYTQYLYQNLDSIFLI